MAHLSFESITVGSDLSIFMKEIILLYKGVLFLIFKQNSFILENKNTKVNIIWSGSLYI